MPDSELAYVEHAGHRIACLAHPNADAEKLPVIWLHGLTMSVRFWERAMFDRVKAERSWYSISLPLHYPSTFSGHIDSEVLDEDLFAELLARSIEEYVPEGKFHLVGHSLGGFAALNYAAKHRDRVASVVSVGGFMTGRAKGLEGALQFLSGGHSFRKALFFVAFWILKSHIIFLKGAALSYAREWRSLLSYPELDGTLANVFPDIRRHSITAQLALCRYLLEMDLFDETGSIDQPVLVIAGKKDPIIPYEHQKKCAAALKHGELLTFPKSGHLTFAESPEAFEAALLAWLDRFG